MMETTVLGRTGLTVSRSAFGALPIQRLTKAEAARLLRRAFDGGITFFDTARVYSDSEEKMAMGLGALRRQIIIATKTQAATPDVFRQHLDTSLATLGTDHVDIYQFHNPERVPLADSPLYACMLDARAQGKIRHIGITCHKLTNAQIALDSGLYETIRFPLSAISSPAELDWARACGQHGVGVIAMKALCGGLLTSAAPSMAALRPMPHVVPIWGFQRDSDLDEVLALEQSPPALDEAMRARIARDRDALGKDFCRGCGYCAPCAADIEINTCARMPLLLRRAVYQNFLTPRWHAEMDKIDACIECGQCMARCPYQLEIPRLLRAALADYRAFAAEHGAQ